MKSRPLFPRRPGYVLVLTLVLLALVAAGLAGVARQSHQASLHASQLEREAQRRWLSLSAESLLPHAQELLETRTASSDLPASDTGSENTPGAIQIDLDLGHHQVRLTLADEQTKANLNALWDQHAPAVFDTKVQQLAAASGWDAGIASRPIGTFEATAASSDLDWPTFVSFEQVLPATQFRSYLSETAVSLNVLDVFTLWGSGQLNWQRARPEVLQAVLTPLLSPSQVDQLAADQPGTRSLDALDLTDRQAERLTDLLTEESDTFSVWQRFDDGRRIRTQLSITTGTDSDQSVPPVRLHW